MNDKPETPSEGMDEARAETPRAQDMPSTDAGSAYSPPPPSSPASWQPGQYNSGAAGTTDLSGGTPAMPTPPPYSQAPAQSPQQYGPPPSYPQGQPTQYMPPPQSQYGPPPSYPAAGPPTVSAPGQPPMYQPGNYGGGYPQYPQAMGYGNVQPKDPTVGLLLELLGYVGFLGIGHIWAGKTTRGIGLLVGWWVFLTMSWVLIFVLVGCLLLVASLAVPIASGLYLKSEMEREQAAMGIRR